MLMLSTLEWFYCSSYGGLKSFLHPFKVDVKRDLLKDAAERWAELDAKATPLHTWMFAVEELVSRDVYESNEEMKCSLTAVKVCVCVCV